MLQIRVYGLVLSNICTCSLASGLSSCRRHIPNGSPGSAAAGRLSERNEDAAPTPVPPVPPVHVLLISEDREDAIGRVLAATFPSPMFEERNHTLLEKVKGEAKIFYAILLVI